MQKNILYVMGNVLFLLVLMVSGLYAAEDSSNRDRSARSSQQQGKFAFNADVERELSEEKRNRRLRLRPNTGNGKGEKRKGATSNKMVTPDDRARLAGIGVPPAYNSRQDKTDHAKIRALGFMDQP